MVESLITVEELVRDNEPGAVDEEDEYLWPNAQQIKAAVYKAQ
jgi:hypothetical protein